MMIKRGKKKWKSKRPETSRVKPTECANQSRNSLTSSHQHSGGKERQSRNPKKMKSPNNRPKYLWHRSKSVPSKTVSFSPYVLHRFAQAPTRVRADVSRSNSCSVCRQKAGAKRSIANKKKPVTERCSQQQPVEDPCAPVDNVFTTAYDNFHTASSPGSARSRFEHTYPDFDYQPSQRPGASHVYYPELSDRSHNYRPQAPNPSLSYGASSSVGPAYVSDFGSNHSPWPPVKRSLHTTPGLRNRGADAKYDFLMAKYSEHNCPRTHPALSDYFSFQRLSLDSGENLGNVSRSKSPSAHREPVVPSRSRSQTRSERMSQTGPVGSSQFLYDKYYTGFSAPHNYSTGHGYRNADLYQSEAMRDMIYNTISQKYIDKSSTNGSYPIRNSRADPEFSSVFQRCRSSSSSFPLADKSSTYGSRLRVNPGTGRKYEFFDDMCLIGKGYGGAKSSTFPSVLSGMRSGVNQRSRSTDASFATRLSSYEEKETPGPGKAGFDSAGEYATSGNRQIGNWMSSYGKMDNLQTSVGNLENWKGSYGRLDDTIPASKYTGASSLRKGSCVNNSNERIPYLHQTTSEYMCPTNGLYSSSWAAMTKRSAPYADSKTIDADTFISRFDETESRRLYDKYACLGNANTSASEHTSRIFKEDSRDVDAKTSICGQGREYKSLSSLARDKSLSPTGRRKRFSSNSRNFSSLFFENDMSYERKDGLGKHHSSGLAFEQLPTASECKVSNFDSNHNYHNLSFLTARNLNMNHTQSSGIKQELKPNASTSSNQSWKCHPCTGYTYNSESTSVGPAQRSGCSALGTTHPEAQYSSCCFDSAASILNSMVDQETDRLKKLAGVIERQQDGSQDTNNDIVF